MKKILLKLFDKYLTGKLVLIFIVTIGILYAFMLLVSIPKLMSFSGGMKILDMMPAGYDINYVTELFTRLGETGRMSYLLEQIPVDLIYPAIYGIGLCFVFAWFLKKLNKLNSGLVYLCILPVLAGFFDYCENVGIIRMLKTYPEISPNLVQITNIFSILKSSLSSLYFLILIVVILIFVFWSIKLKRKA